MIGWAGLKTLKAKVKLPKPVVPRKSRPAKLSNRSVARTLTRQGLAVRGCHTRSVQSWRLVS